MIVSEMFFIIAVQLPQLSDDLSLTPTTSSIMVSWSSPQFPPDSYNVSYSCQLLCGSELYLSSSDTVNGSVTTHTITSLNAGSNCTVSVTAVYGSNTSNTITSSTDTISTGKITLHVLLYHTCILLYQLLLVLLKVLLSHQWRASHSL